MRGEKEEKPTSYKNMLVSVVRYAKKVSVARGGSVPERDQ